MTPDFGKRGPLIGEGTDISKEHCQEQAWSEGPPHIGGRHPITTDWAASSRTGVQQSQDRTGLPKSWKYLDIAEYCGFQERLDALLFWQPHLPKASLPNQKRTAVDLAGTLLEGAVAERTLVL
jgi:hypothetical protein